MACDIVITVRRTSARRSRRMRRAGGRRGRWGSRCVSTCDPRIDAPPAPERRRY